MAIIIPTSFTKYQLTKEETIAGSLLNDNQKQVIQNLLADTAEQKINLNYNAAELLVFAQEEARLTGQMEILRTILALDEQARAIQN